MTLKLKKDLKIPYVRCFISLLIIICTLHAKFQKKKNKYMPVILLLVQH